MLRAWERDCVHLRFGWSALCCSVRRPVSKTNSNHLIEFRDLCTMISGSMTISCSQTPVVVPGQITVYLPSAIESSRVPTMSTREKHPPV